MTFIGRGTSSQYIKGDGTWGTPSGGPGGAAWGDITGTLSAQNDLQTALNAKAASTHTHAQSDIIDLPSTLAGYSTTTHTHPQSSIVDLPTTLAGFSTTTHTHTGVYEPAKGSDDNYVTDAQLVVLGNTSGTNTGDNATNTQYSGLAASKADVVHTHAQSDIADLPTTLSGYATTSHTHTGVYEPADATILKDADIGVTIQGYNATLNATTGIFNTDDKAKLTNIVVTQTVDLDTLESDTATNNAKVSNATHTGDATGATALTVVKIQGKDFPTLSASDDQKYPKYVSGSNAFVMTAIAGGGDVTGPSASSDNAIPRFDGAGGKTLQGSPVTIDDEGSLIPIPGNTNYPPIDMVSGVVTSTAVAGAIEYDGKVHYTTHEASARGVNIAEQFITLTSAYTLPTAGPGLRAMFNSPANGAVTVKSNTTYWFEVMGALTSLSATSGTYSFGFLGTASTPSIRYVAISNKAAVTPVAALIANVTTTTSTALVAANTTTTGQFTARGKLVVETGGTLIPAIGNSVEALPIVGINSTFRIYPLGNQTVQSVGNWS